MIAIVGGDGVIGSTPAGWQTDREESPHMARRCDQHPTADPGAVRDRALLGGEQAALLIEAV